MVSPLDMIKLMEDGIKVYLKSKKEEFPLAKEC